MTTFSYKQLTGSIVFSISETECDLPGWTAGLQNDFTCAGCILGFIRDEWSRGVIQSEKSAPQETDPLILCAVENLFSTLIYCWQFGDVAVHSPRFEAEQFGRCKIIKVI